MSDIKNRGISFRYGNDPGSVNGSVEKSLPPVCAREKIDATVSRGNPDGSLSFVFLIYDADRNEESRWSFLKPLATTTQFFLILREST